MNFFSRGVRNAFRNYTRTSALVLILGLGLGLSLAMLVAHKAVSDRISAVKGSVGNTVTIMPAGFSGFSEVNNALSSSDLNKVSSLPHVSSLAESLTDRLTTIGSMTPTDRFGNSNASGQTNLTSPVNLNDIGKGEGGGQRIFIAGGGQLPTNFSLPILILGTNDTSHINNATLNISSGHNINGQQDSNQALVSQAMASKNNLQVGSTFSAYNTNLTVSGIFSSSNQGGNNTILVSLPTEQRLSGQAGDITSATAYVDSLDNLSSTTTAIKNTLGSSADVTSSVDQANQAVQPLNSVKSISLYSLIGAAIAAAVIILMTMIMIVRERRREIGVLKAIGASNLKIVSQFASEALTLTFLAAIVGIILGVLASNPITHLLVNSSSSNMGPGRFGGGGFITRAGGFGRGNLATVHAVVGWSIIIYGLLIALLISIVASTLTSFVISKVRPAEVMRSE